MDVKNREVILSDDVLSNVPVNENSKVEKEEMDNNEKSLASSQSDIISPTTRRDLRTLAFLYLYALDRLDYTVSIESIIDNFRRGFGIDVPKDSYAIKLALQTSEMRGDLDLELLPLLKNWKIERISCCILVILRMALWELKQSDAIPNVIINEAIEIAKGYAEKDAYKFINGILDEAVKVQEKKKKKQLVEDEREEDTEEKVEVSKEQKE